MNVLGHSYVVWKTVGRLNKYVVAGSHLPDLVPFVPDSVFSFEEIHESSEKVLRFLEKDYPQARDLALGMMSHSVEFGVDKFNPEIEGWLLGGRKKLREELARDIVDCSGVSLKTARGYIIHNFLWGGIDVYLLRNKRSEVEKLAEVHRKIDRGEIARFLVECLQKEEKEVWRMVDWFLGPIRPERLISVGGLVEIWEEHSRGLSDVGLIDQERTAQLAKKIYALFEDRWEGILEKVVAETKKNLAPFV